tara:strand:- start:803 stop:2212 length:1410 start_codon:yes stop_codon:yes gene_type:complete
LTVRISSFEFHLPNHQRKHWRVDRPNIVLINVSEAGWHFACYGASSVRTPNIDRLSAAGARFDHMYSTASISSPSRVSLMTGQHVQRHGMGELVKIQWPCSMLDHSHHLSHVLRNAGYRTALFGFQHEAANMDDLGFDTRNRETLYDEPWPWGDTLDPAESYPAAIPPEKEVPATDTARDFAAYVDSNTDGDQPFFAQIGIFEVQGPLLWAGLEAGDPDSVELPSYLALPETNPEGLRQQVANVEASLARVDDGVGIVLEGLERNGMARNTLVVLTTDHGPGWPRAKWGMCENSNRVAFVMRWPDGPITPGVYPELASQIDFVPTLAEWIGLTPPQVIDGKSFAPLLRGEPWSRGEPAFAYNLYCRLYAARSQRYRLIRNFAGISFNKLTRAENADVPAVELYDHDADPDETQNLADDPAHAAAFREIDSALWEYLIAFDDRILQTEEECEAAEQCRQDLKAYRERRGR